MPRAYGQQMNVSALLGLDPDSTCPPPRAPVPLEDIPAGGGASSRDGAQDQKLERTAALQDYIADAICGEGGFVTHLALDAPGFSCDRLQQQDDLWLYSVQPAVLRGLRDWYSVHNCSGTVQRTHREIQCSPPTTSAGHYVLL